MYMLFCVVALVGASCTNSGWLMTRHCCFTVLGESYSAHSIAQQPRREVFVLLLLPETNGVSLEAENKKCFRLLMLLLYFRLATLVGIIIPFTVHVPLYRRKDVFDELVKTFLALHDATRRRWKETELELQAVRRRWSTEFTELQQIFFRQEDFEAILKVVNLF